MAKPKTITNNDRVYNNLEQYILSRNLNKLVKFNEQEAREKKEFQYCTFRQVNGKGSQLINRLRGIDDLSVFYNIKSSTLSLLQPKIRLYKVQYEDYKVLPNGEVDQSSVRSLPVPCYKEFKFSDNFGIETAASVNDYLNYESTKPSFRNVGLYGFTIIQDGETHGTIENNIECKLELKFKSLKDLNASPPGEPNLKYTDLVLWPPARITKLTETYNPKYYEIKVLLGYTAPTPKQLYALNLSSREVNAVRDIEKMNQIVALGMHDYDIKISENGVVSVTVSFRGRLETVIGSNQVNVFQDSIRIGDAGQFEITKKAKSEMNISHVYKTATTMKAIYRALNDSECIKNCAEKKTLKDLTENDVLFSLLVKEAIGSTDAEGLRKAGLQVRGAKKKLKVVRDNKYYEWFKRLDNLKRTLGMLKNKVGIFKQDIYVGFIDALVQTHDIKGKLSNRRAGGLPPTRVYCATVSPDKVLESVGTLRKVKKLPAEEESDEPTEGEETTGEPTAGGIEVSQSEIDRVLKNFSKDIEGSLGKEFLFTRCLEGVGELKKQNEAAGALVGTDGIEAESEGSEDEAETEEGEQEKKPVGLAPSWMSDGKYKFYFVYLGDIIELACKNARIGALDFDDLKNKAGRGATIFPWKEYKKIKEQDSATSYPLVNARILLGPLEYMDEDGKIQTTNLAKMPISFAYFRSWFIDKLIKRRRTQMPLGAFFASLINDLVIPALGINMPQSFKVPNTRASIISITLPGEVVANHPGHKICGKNVPATIEALPRKRIIDTEGFEFQKYLKKVVGKRESESMLLTSFDYLLLYVTSFKDVTERNADPAEDIKDGIYHFNIGSDMGLLRSMDFSRVNIPFLAELRSAQAEEQGIDQLQQLKLPYDTNINLVGTSLFTPGMYYYVNPSLAGLGSVKNASSLAYQMNLGGYHLIGKVSTRIYPGHFETQIVGTQTAQGKR